MAQSKKTTPQVDAIDKNANLDNGKVEMVPAVVPAADVIKTAYAALNATLKAAGFDHKALYTRYSADPDDVKEDLAAQVTKHAKNANKGFDQSTMDSVVAMFDAMAKANAPKAKLVKAIPAGLAEDLAQAWFHRQQVLAAYEAAKKAVETLWCEPRDVSKNELDAACKAVTDAGFSVSRKTGTIAKSGTSKTDGEHGNAGTTKLSIGWIDINIGGVEYDSWKSAVQALEPDMIVATSTNYLANTQFANKCAEKGLPISVSIKLALKGHTAEDALEAWNTIDTNTGKFASGAHRKLAEVGASITVA